MENFLYNFIVWFMEIRTAFRKREGWCKIFLKCYFNLLLSVSYNATAKSVKWDLFNFFFQFIQPRRCKPNYRFSVVLVALIYLHLQKVFKFCPFSICMAKSQLFNQLQLMDLHSFLQKKKISYTVPLVNS